MPQNIKDGAVRVANTRNLHTGVKVNGTELMGARRMIDGEAQYKRMKSSYGEVFTVSSYRPLCKRRRSCYAVLRTEPEMYVQIEAIVHVGNDVFIDFLQFDTQPLHCYDPQYALCGVNGITVEHIVHIGNIDNIMQRWLVAFIVGICVRVNDYFVHIPFVHTSSS